MSDKKISQLTASTTPLAGTELVPVVQNGLTKKVAVSDLTAGRAVAMSQMDAGNIRATGNTVSATNTNGDVKMAPNGTGAVVFDKGSVSSIAYAKATSTRSSYGVVSAYQDDSNGGKAAFGVNAYTNTQYSANLNRVATDMVGWALYGSSQISTYENQATFNLVHITAGGVQKNRWIVDYNGNLLAGTDNNLTLGGASNRWSTVYAGNGTINTSDRNEKTDISELDEAEKRVAQKVKSLIKKFRFVDSVHSKGDKARIHVGAIAQEVAEAFSSEGLDADRYGMFCSDTWRTYNGQPVPVNENNEYIEKFATLNGERISEIPVDEEGNAVLDGVELHEISHQTEPKTRLGLRYEQLLAFVISAI